MFPWRIDASCLPTNHVLSWRRTRGCVLYVVMRSNLVSTFSNSVKSLELSLLPLNGEFGWRKLCTRMWKSCCGGVLTRGIQWGYFLRVVAICLLSWSTFSTHYAL